MTERELIYVKTIAEERSISRAAKKLFMTQPSLSSCVQKIETSLGARLFQRTTTGLVLTFAGERYYQIAKDILKIYSDFEIEVSDINNLKKGRITVGITVYLATYILPVILPEFKQLCPNIEVSIVEKNSTELAKSLTTGEIDFALMHALPFEESALQASTTLYPLSRDPLVLATKKGHPLGQFAVQRVGVAYPHIDLSLFANEPFILVNKEQKIRQVADLVLHKAQISPPVILTTKSFETTRRLACTGIGSTFVPLQYLNIFPGSYPCDYYFVDDSLNAWWTLCVAVQKNAYVSQAAKLFLRIVSEKYGDQLLELD
jgi:DNA-binding transcriptional LysR family regulator